MTKKEFDSIIKQNVLRVTGHDDFGYELSKTYEDYYSKSAFAKFLDEMQTMLLAFRVKRSPREKPLRFRIRYLYWKKQAPDLIRNSFYVICWELQAGKINRKQPH